MWAVQVSSWWWIYRSSGIWNGCGRFTTCILANIQNTEIGKESMATLCGAGCLLGRSSYSRFVIFAIFRQHGIRCTSQIAFLNPFSVTIAWLEAGRLSKRFIAEAASRWHCDALALAVAAGGCVPPRGPRSTVPDKDVMYPCAPPNPLKCRSCPRPPIHNLGAQPSSRSQ